MPNHNNGKLLIVSNRLPVSIDKQDSGIRLKPTVGGLATGLGSFYRKYNAAWVGWPGVVAKEDKSEVETRLIQDLNCYPVFISEKLVEKYYEGFSNKTIWPLFHSFPAHTKYSAAEWEAYREANLLFGEAIGKLAQPGDAIWVHDYHLMLLPQYLRQKYPDMAIGFFLHIPFPSGEIFRLLPWHREIMDSLLCCDLLGYHTYDYVQSFLRSVRRVAGYDNNIGLIMTKERAVQVDVFPIGIDFEKFSTASQMPPVQEEIDKIVAVAGNSKIIFSVSRLDYTKGVPENLDAIEEFLEKYPEWRKKIAYVVVIVPSREKVEKYANLKKTIDEQVGRINSKYGTLDWMPIRYIYRSLNFQELTALYYKADVALVAPLRDGMNLIAKEYLATKADGTGVLVLSDMAGAAKELQEAIIVNPNSKEEVAAAVHKALLMPPEEQKRRNGVMRKRLEQYNITWWASHFLNRLQEANALSKSFAGRMLDTNAQKHLHNQYAKAGKRLIILDYDGTLMPFASEPLRAYPDAALMELLQQLCLPMANTIVVLSGRDQNTLETWLGKLDMTLGAEHGGSIKYRGTTEWKIAVTTGDDSWKKQTKTIMQLFVDRIPGSLVEEKRFGIAWHYRKTDYESSVYAARELLDTLTNLTANLPIQVLSGNKIIEVRNVGISKGSFYTCVLSQRPWDFILAIGDDTTDEELFAALPASAHSIKVGLGISKARFHLQDVNAVRALLNKLVSA